MAGRAKLPTPAPARARPTGGQIRLLTGAALMGYDGAGFGT